MLARPLFHFQRVQNVPVFLRYLLEQAQPILMTCYSILINLLTGLNRPANNNNRFFCQAPCHPIAPEGRFFK